MDFLHPQVVLEPIILGNLVIEENEANPQSASEFLETFRRNQPRTVNGPNDGALVLIRANGIGVDRRNVLLPAIIPRQPPLVGNRVIPLPEFAPVRNGSDRIIASEEITRTAEEEEEEMGPFKGIWSCECPVPGSGPLMPCTECRRRECFEWSWDREFSESTAVIQNSDKDVFFNPGYSVGTVAVRGTTPLKQGYHHYWEIEMSSEVYGTDMMIGIGTEKADLKQHSHSFVSLIGLDEESWGLSYSGAKHHNGKVQHYTKSFYQHTVVGVHVDLWSGHLEFYINRKPIGRAFSGLQGKVLYPMISSTAARSSMNLVFCRSYAPSLQLQTMLSLGKSMLLPDNVSLFKVLPDNIVPPGLKLWMKNNFWWITSNKESEKKVETISRKKTEVKGQSRPSIIITDSTSQSGGIQPIRRVRKTRKDDTSDQELTAVNLQERVTTRSMAVRRTFLAGTNPIFAPIPAESPSPAKSLKVSKVSRPMTRSNSSPSVRDARHLTEDDEESEDENDLPPRASSSNSNQPRQQPGSKRMCLRSSKR